MTEYDSLIQAAQGLLLLDSPNMSNTGMSSQERTGELPSTTVSNSRPDKNPGQPTDLFTRRVRRFYRQLESAECLVRSENPLTDDLIAAKTKLAHLNDECEAAGEDCDMSDSLNNTLDEITHHCSQITSRINDRIKRCKTEEAQTGLISENQHFRPTAPQVHLSKLPTPKFDNEGRSYSSWKKATKTLIERYQTEELALLRPQNECVKKVP